MNRLENDKTVMEFKGKFVLKVHKNNSLPTTFYDKKVIG